MAQYPDAIFTGRTMANRPGVSFDSAKSKVIYAEDFNDKRDEIIAIQNELGTNAKGAYGSVKAWLTALAAAIAAKADPLGFTPENVSNKDTTVTLGTSDTKYPSQKAVKNFVENAGGGNTKYRFMGFRNAAENSGSGGIIKMNNIIEDPNSNYNTTTGQYTCPVAGVYYIAGRASFQAMTGRAFVSIFKNGTSVLRGIDLTMTSSIVGSVVTGLVKCAAGDTLDLNLYCSITTAPFENDMPTSQRYLHIHLLSN